MQPGWLRISRQARLFCSKSDPFSPYFRSKAGSDPGARRDAKRPPPEKPRRPPTNESRPPPSSSSSMSSTTQSPPPYASTGYSQSRSKPPPKPSRPTKNATQLQELMETTVVNTDKGKEVRIVRGMTVNELSQAMGIKIKHLKSMIESLVGHPPRSDDSVVPLEAAELCVLEHGLIPKIVDSKRYQNLERAKHDKSESLKFSPRQGVVVVMGHVDHGKTTLIDTLRGSKLAAAEAGGITQNVGAFQVTSKDGTSFTFIDTPGHAAFARMRARGAKVTDVAILVVSAVDGVQQQTVEAIKHSVQSGVPIVVAINKCDLPAADPVRVRGQLIEHGLLAEDLGGAVQMIEISAKTGDGVPDLLDAVALQLGEVDPRADVESAADGFVLEANLTAGVGASITVLPLSGTLKVGDCFVAGAAWGRVRSLVVDGKPATRVLPGRAAVVTGLRGVPSAGDEFIVTDSETRAKEVVRIREEHKSQKRINRNAELAKAVEEAGCKEQCVIIKGDTTGSVEAIIECIHNVPVDEVAMRVIRHGVGPVSDSDLQIAGGLDKIIIYAFNVRVPPSTLSLARSAGVEIRRFDVIYGLLDDIHATLSSLLEPTKQVSVLGQAEVQGVFVVKGRRQRHEQYVVAGLRVTEGRIQRSDGIRIYRKGVLVHEGAISSMKHHKDNVMEVDKSMECGVIFDKFDDVKEGDTIEAIKVTLVPRKLPDDVFLAKPEEPERNE